MPTLDRRRGFYGTGEESQRVSVGKSGRFPCRPYPVHGGLDTRPPQRHGKIRTTTFVVVQTEIDESVERDRAAPADTLDVYAVSAYIARTDLRSTQASVASAPREPAGQHQGPAWLRALVGCWALGVGGFSHQQLIHRYRLMACILIQAAS